MKFGERTFAQTGVSASGRVLEFEIGCRSREIVSVRDTGRRVAPVATDYRRIYGKRFA